MSWLKDKIEKSKMETAQKSALEITITKYVKKEGANLSKMSVRELLAALMTFKLYLEKNNPSNCKKNSDIEFQFKIVDASVRYIQELIIISRKKGNDRGRDDLKLVMEHPDEYRKFLVLIELARRNVEKHGEKLFSPSEVWEKLSKIVKENLKKDS